MHAVDAVDEIVVFLEICLIWKSTLDCSHAFRINCLVLSATYSSIILTTFFQYESS